jgi:hypothetical protein
MAPREAANVAVQINPRRLDFGRRGGYCLMCWGGRNNDWGDGDASYINLAGKGTYDLRGDVCSAGCSP